MWRPIVRTWKPIVAGAVLTGLALAAARGQTDHSLEGRILQITSRAEFAHTNFAIEFIDLTNGRVVYALNPHQFSVPASTTKLLTEGAALAKLGPSFRFETRVYRTGPVDRHGILHGDVVLLASGDPNMSGSPQPDGTLKFSDNDHVEGGPPITGNPLAVYREIATQIRRYQIRKVTGSVFIDSSLFLEGSRELGSGVVLSPISLNDNVIDITVKPGSKAGDPAAIEVSPDLPAYMKIHNEVKSVGAGQSIFMDDRAPKNRDGSMNLTVSGTIGLSSKQVNLTYAVPLPSRFATAALEDALTTDGVKINRNADPRLDLKSARKGYVPADLIAEHDSPPLSQDIKLTLKVSQNMHAEVTLRMLGRLLAKEVSDPVRAGFQVEKSFLLDANLDLPSISQSDGSGGDWADRVTPDFMCRYLAYWHTRPDFQIFFDALPVLGKDGTLAEIGKDSPAAGHVFAKTGTLVAEDLLNDRLMVNGKGLAGYVRTRSGRILAFAAYANCTSAANNGEVASKVGQALGKISGAAFDGDLP